MTGNVSLYNQNPDGPVDPFHRSHGWVVEEERHVATQWFKEEGDAVILLGEPVDTEDALQGLGGSAYLQVA